LPIPATTNPAASTCHNYLAYYSLVALLIFFCTYSNEVRIRSKRKLVADLPQPTHLQDTGTSTMAPPPPSFVPAWKLLEPQGLKLYQRWRQAFTGEALEDKNVPLPNAQRYALYLEWRDLRRARSFPDIYTSKGNGLDWSGATGDSDSALEGFVKAEKCGHPLHPGHPDVVAAAQAQNDRKMEDGDITEVVMWCPMCHLQLHSSHVEAIYQK
jgi:hypothetical protein